MSTKNQREQLVHAAIGQCAIIGWVIIASWLYTIPHFNQLSASVLKANETIIGYNEVLTNGIAYKNLEALLKTSKWKEELITIIKAAPAETQKVITKDWKEQYLTWILGKIGESSEAKQLLAIKKARLNSILPTLNPVSNNLNEDTINLKKYIAFVEESIIQKFGMKTTGALSLQNIQYGKKGWSMPETVWSFDNEISFKSTNQDIAKMIDYINDLGKPDILTDSGSSKIGNEPGIMSNPLAMIDSLSLDAPLDLGKPTEENSGRMTIRFYIRGSSPNDISFLTSNLATRKTALGKKIEATITKCNWDVTCPKKKELQALLVKFNEFNKWTSIKKTGTQGGNQIYTLSSELNSVNSMEEELIKLTGK